MRDDGNGILLYAGEACRELFLIAILYVWIVKKIEPKDIDYSRFMEY
jgi:hypothetical protein